MGKLHPNVPILAICVCLWMSCSSLIVASASLVGANLATDRSLATLPLAMQFIATMCTSIPAAMLMHRIGRKAAFMLSTFFGVGGGLLAGSAILAGNFALFVMAATAIGIFNGFASYFRFAAADSVGIAYKSRAISIVMAGGVLAAVVGPNLAKYTRTWIADFEFAGSYLAIIAFYSMVLLALAFLQLDDKKPVRGSSGATGRSLTEIVRQKEYIVAVICCMLGYGVMALVMTATPLAMDDNTLLFDDTSVVIQWHVLAMFAPSFFTGNLIVRFGLLRIMLAGALLGLLCVAINLMGRSFHHFLFALIALGVSWNFLFVGSTTLLTETYHPEEKHKAQAFNDFVVFTTVALASLSAGVLQNAYGWRMVNIGVVPLLGIVLLSIIWLGMHRSRRTALQSTV